MADKKEKDLTKVSDAAYIRALDSNGNPVLISKADLAQVAAELMPVADRLTDGFMSHTDYFKLNPLVVNSSVILRIGDIEPWHRTFALIVGQISNRYVAFLWFVSYSGTTILEYNNIQCLAGKETIEECVKLYTKDGYIYLDVDYTDKNSAFVVLSNFKTEQVWEQVDDTFTLLNPTIS